MTQERLAGWEGRSAPELAMLAAWLNVSVDQIPANNRAHLNPSTMAAWQRVYEAAAAEARLAAIEAAAEVAETRHEHWCEPGDHAVECDVSACRDIATAIRNLAPPPPPAVVGEGG